MPKTIEDLRDRLFAAIDGVKAGTTTVEQAKTIGDLSQVIVNTAKVEIEYLKVIEEGKSTFLGGESEEEAKPLPNGIVGVTRHILQG